MNPYPAAPRVIAPTLTASAILVGGKHTPVDATAGPITVTLPTIGAGYAGAHLSVEKTDTSTNLVTISGNIRGTASTLTLGYAHETIEFHTDATGAWFPTANHLPKAVVDAKIAAALTPAHTFVQTFPAAQWTIPHTLGHQPQVSVFDASGNQILADVVCTNTTVTITFANPTAGSAVFS